MIHIFKKSKRETSKHHGFSLISPPLGGAVGWLENRNCPDHRTKYSPGLVKIGRKMAEKIADRQTRTQTSR
jgi:hypothetical protein